MNGWNHVDKERHLLCDNEFPSRAQIRREPSPESVSSMIYYSSFNFEEMRNNVEDLSQDINKEHRQPVQHPSGNDCNHLDQKFSSISDSNFLETNLEISDINENSCNAIPKDHDESYNSIKVSYISSENGYPSHVQNFTNKVDPQKRVNMIHPNPTPPNAAVYHCAPGQVPNAYIYPSSQIYTSGEMMHPHMQHSPVQFTRQQQRFLQPHQQQHHLTNGYSSISSNIGLTESFHNISPPAPIDCKRVTSKESVENDSTNSYFSTILLSGSYNENGPSQAPIVKTVSADVPEKTTRPYVTTASPAAPPIKEKVKVFVTYAEERQNPDHIRTVVQISQTLFKNSIEVTVDVLEETVRAMSISDWLESNITNSDFVLICVSPSYRQVVDGQPLASGFDSPQNENAVNTQYIYRRIHAEYISCGSKNYRFIPVLVSGASVQNIPPWLRDTKVFEWPKDYEDIIYRLFRQERFVKPTPGPAPQHRIELYNSCNSRQTTKSFDKDGKPTQSK